MVKVAVTKDKLDDLALHIAVKADESLPMTIDEMCAAVDGIHTGGNIWQDAQGYLVLDDDGSGGGEEGGGPTNIVSGTFTTSASSGAQTVSIPYSGSGYPIVVLVFIDMDTVPYTAYDLNNWFVSFLVEKKSIAAAPAYDGNTSNNSYRTQCIYINGNTYNSGGNVSNAYSASGADATSSAVLGLRLTSNTTLSAYVREDSYGFLSSTEYRYVVVYSE